jgi:hypothetical protein
LAFDNFVLFDRVHLPICLSSEGARAVVEEGLLSVRESVHEIADCPERCAFTGDIPRIGRHIRDAESLFRVGR